jgi:hypothetical protein
MKLELNPGRIGLAAVVGGAVRLRPCPRSIVARHRHLGAGGLGGEGRPLPEDACKELEASGFKCMGLKPAVKYSLPASSFKVGSAELPELLKKQLDVFAEVLRSKKGTARQIKVTGHADASGTPEANQQLSSSGPRRSRSTWCPRAPIRAC